MRNPQEVNSEFNGILFIGDPHVSSKRPGRRKDDYLSSVLEKLAHCAELCEQFNLLPVILGDLMHRHDDSAIRMLNRLTATLNLFPVPPISLDGNHCKGEFDLTEEDTVYLLNQMGVIQSISKPSEVGDFKINGQLVRLFATPYGFEIPSEVSAPDGYKTVMITHHDLAFDSAYPGAIELFAIKGLDHVVNGHMHATKPSRTLGSTVWHNPGNIEPLSVDLINHIPRAWAWDGQASELSGLELPHGTDIFDITGLQVEASDAAEAIQVLTHSKFAEVVSQDKLLCQEAERTQDASVLQSDLEDIITAGNISEPAKAMLALLMERVQSNLESSK